MNAYTFAPIVTFSTVTLRSARLFESPSTNRIAGITVPRGMPLSPVSPFHSLAAAGLPATRVGDCFAPATIAAAVHSGRKFAENFGDPPEDYLELPFRREVTALA